MLVVLIPDVVIVDVPSSTSVKDHAKHLARCSHDLAALPVMNTCFCH